MGSSRTPGVIGEVQGSVHLDDGTLCRNSSPVPGPTGSEKLDANGLTEEQKGLLLDTTQFVLDIVGIVEPTPFADTTNAVISAGRGDWLGAGLSLISVVPYVGDIAKVGKLPRYVQSLKKAISLAKSDMRFAAHLEPVLGRLLRAIDALPGNKLSAETAAKVYRLRRMINAFLYRKLIGRVLKRGLGAIPESGLVRENIETLVDYIVSHQRRYKVWGEGGSAEDIERALNIGGLRSSHDIEKAVLEAASAIDVHKPISIVRFEQGAQVSQYVDQWKSVDGTVAIKRTAEEMHKYTGNWITLRQGAGGADSLGISAEGRVLLDFKVKQSTEVLQSSAAAVGDSWTANIRANLIDGLGASKGQPVIFTRGGGTQYFLPQMHRRNITFLELDLGSRRNLEKAELLGMKVAAGKLTR
jgi:hypothetical protein